MARNKTKSRDSLFARWRKRWERVDGVRKKRLAERLAQFAVCCLFIGSIAYGLVTLEGALMASPGRQAPPKIRLVDVPASLSDLVAESLTQFSDSPWMSPTLCADIASALERNAWVERVVDVHRFPDQRVEVRCEYRLPFAMVQTDHGFYLIDDDGVRLPGVYVNTPGMKIIQGVGAAPSRPGEKWIGSDVVAGLELLELILNEPFADQITAVLVHNHKGRLDRRRPHLQLATDHAGGRIIWGSAIGEEIEENTAAQKLELLRANYRRYGRVDAGRGVIDISVHEDRIIAPHSTP